MRETERSGEGVGAPARGDLLLAFVAGAGAFAVYLSTLYPGLLPVGDAAKFSFVGRVLGTPHAPGYPLYVMVSHLFSYVPWGTLAYRMNAFSALLGSVAVAVVFLIARSLGASRPSALASALALAFGDAFWSRALYAKAYTLHAALVATGMLLLLHWERVRQPRWLYLAAGVFALSLGNHLTVIALLPALVLFPLLTDARTVLRPRPILVIALLVAAGLSQYLFVLIRTLQHAPYLEARAENLQQLWAVMTARRFAREIGAYSLDGVLTTRVPAIWRLVATELRWLGALAVVPGAVLLARRQPRRAVLFLVGALGVLALTANMGSEEDQGFLLAAFVLLWPLAALGMDLAVTTVGRLARPLSPVVAALLAIALPLNQVVHNLAANDHHADTFETRYFDTLFDSLPAKAAIVSDDYRLNMMVLYKLLGERAAQGRDIRMIPASAPNVTRYHAKGFQIFAFENGSEKMREYGALFAPFVGTTPAASEILRRRPVFRLVSSSTCRNAGNLGWVDLAGMIVPDGRLSVRVDNVRPFDSRIVVYAVGDTPLSPALVAGAGVYRTPPVLTMAVFDRNPDGRRRLAAQSAADHAGLPEKMVAVSTVTRVEVHVNDDGQFAQFGLDLGTAVRWAIGQATVDSDDPKRATFCSHALSAHDAWPAGEARALLLPASDVEFVTGWQQPEARPDGTTFRWTTNRAVMVVPLSQARAATLVVDGEPMGYPGRTDGHVTPILNGVRLASRRQPALRTRLSWDIPAGSWRTGLNELVFDVEGARRPSDLSASQDTRLLGLAIFRMELVPLPEPPRAAR